MRSTRQRNATQTGIVLAWIVLALSWAAGAAEPGQEGWKPLFDGQTLAGWENPYDWGKAWVEDGEIQLQADKKFFLTTERPYRDFIFEAEVKMPEGDSNSGFMFRCHVGDRTMSLVAYHAEVDPSERSVGPAACTTRAGATVLVPLAERRQLREGLRPAGPKGAFNRRRLESLPHP
jgi:hypothetical protein